MPAYDRFDLPSGFWERPLVVQALRTRDVGALFDQVTNQPGITQGMVGTAVAMKQGRISDFIRGAAAPLNKIAAYDRIADGLNMPPRARAQFLTAGKTDAPGTSQTDADDLGEDTGRTYARTDDVGVENFSRLLTADLADLQAVTRTEVSAYAWQHVSFEWMLSRHQPGPSTAGTIPEFGLSPVESINTTRDMFANLDNRFGGGHARHALIQYLKTDVAHLLTGNYSDQVMRDLFSAAAETALLAAWMSYDAGSHGLAQRYFIQGVRLADAGHNRMLSASILDAMSHQATYLGHFQEAEQLALAAQTGTRGQASPILTAHFAMMRARALANMNDATGCDAAILEAETAYGQGPLDEAPEWLRYFDHAELTAEIGHCFRDLGRPTDAAAHLDQFTNSDNGEYQRSDYFATMVQADAHLIHDREKAQASALSALRIGESLKSERTVRYLRDFRTRLAQQGSSRTDADFIEQAQTYALWHRAKPVSG